MPSTEVPLQVQALDEPEDTLVDEGKVRARDEPAIMPTVRRVTLLPTVLLPALLDRAPLSISMLYIFAGAARYSDVASHLRKLCAAGGFLLNAVEVDILRDPLLHDVLDEVNWQGLMLRVTNHEFQVVLVTPPCNTHSRAVWANSDGPKPVRSRVHPLGFPWLQGKQLAKCGMANLFMEKSIEASLVAHSAGAVFLWEHPEDLGVTGNGGNPASVWALEELIAMARSTSSATCAIHQCKYGLDAAKPTRLLGTLPGLKAQPFQGWPQFTKTGHYKGPPNALRPQTSAEAHWKRFVR